MKSINLANTHKRRFGFATQPISRYDVMVAKTIIEDSVSRKNQIGGDHSAVLILEGNFFLSTIFEVFNKRVF